MRNRDLPVTKSLPLLHVYIHTYSSSCTVLVPIYYSTYQPSSNYLPTYSTYSTLHGQEESRINVHFSSPPRVFHQLSFFSFPFVARGITKNYLQYLPTLPGFFSWMPFTVFILGKVGTVVDSSSLRGRKLAGWLAGECTIRGILFWA